MLRTTMLSLSRQSWLRDWMQNSPLASRFTSRFIAGRTLDQALAVCARLGSEGVLSTLDRLGENVTSLDEARESRDAYLKALDGIADSKIGSTVSVKLTQMGLDLSEHHCQENVTALARRAAELGTRVEIDMESSEYTDRTLEQVRRVHEATGNVRAVIQAYLLRSATDVDQLCAAGIPIRLCKGAYHEPPAVAYQQKREVDLSYSRLMHTLLERGVHPAIASHDERLVREAIAVAPMFDGLDGAQIDFLAGQSWFDVTQYRSNPPIGAPMHWSRLVDVPIAGLILLLAPFVGKVLKIDHRNRPELGLPDDLHRDAVEALKFGAQRFVAADQLMDTLFQGREVKFSPHTERDRNMVGRAVRIQLREDPEPLLSERQREGPGPGNGHQWRRLFSGVTPSRRIDRQSQLRHRRTLEKHSHGQINPKYIAQPRHSLCRE